MAQVIDKYKYLSVIHICIGLSLVFSLTKSKQKGQRYFCFIHLKLSPLASSYPSFHCVSPHLFLYQPLILPIPGLVRDMTCLMKLQCSESLELHVAQGNWHFVLGKLMTVSCGTLGLILFPGHLCHERPASVFPAYVIFSSDFTFLEECVRNYIFNNISHHTLT